MSSVWEPVPGSSGIIVAFGPTVSRPTAVPFLYFEYFDTTLGYPVWATQLTGSPILWVDAAGAFV